MLLAMVLDVCLALKLPTMSSTTRNAETCMSRRSLLLAAPAAGALLSGCLPAMAEEAATDEVETAKDEEKTLPLQGIFKSKDGRALLDGGIQDFRFPWDNETDEEKAEKKRKRDEEREKNKYVPPPPPPGSTSIFGKEGLPRAIDKALGIAKPKQ